MMATRLHTIRRISSSSDYRRTIYIYIYTDFVINIITRHKLCVHGLRTNSASDELNDIIIIYIYGILYIIFIILRCYRANAA